MNRNERQRKRTFDRDGERQRQVFEVPSVVLQEDETLVQFWVERREVIQETLFTKPLYHDQVNIN